jgi:hypothetical protein
MRRDRRRRSVDKAKTRITVAGWQKMISAATAVFVVVGPT